MSKRKLRRSNKTQQVNSQPTGFRNMGGQSGKTRYSGAARFVECAPPGIQFRGTFNVDHVTSITFANKIEEIKVWDEEGVIEVEGLDPDGEVTMIEAPSHMENRVTGYTVCIGVGGQQSEFTFAQLQVAVMYYNDVLESIAAIGVPCNFKPKIQVPKPPPPMDDKQVPAKLDGKDLEVASIEAGYEGEDLEDPIDVDDELDDVEVPTEH